MTSFRRRVASLLAAVLAAAVLVLAPPPVATALPCNPDDPSCPDPPSPTLSWTLTVQISGPGTVSWTPVDGTCTSSGPTTSCSPELTEDVYTLTATPAPGYTFGGWTGACSGSSCDVTLDADKSVTATFVDTTPPDAPQIVRPQSGEVIQSATDGSTTIAFSDADSSVTHACRMDSISYASGRSCTSPWSSGPLATGSHTAYVWSEDAAGNLSGATTRSFKVVNVPDTVIDGTPADGSVTDSPSTAFTFTGVDMRCTLDAAAVPCPVDGVLDVSAGTHTLTVASGISPFGDDVWYHDATPAARTWTYEPAPPILQQSAARVSARWRVVQGRTRVRSMIASQLPARGRVVVRCVGNTCPFGIRKPPVRLHRADLGRLFGMHAMKPRTRIEIRITAPGYLARTVVYVTRRTKPPTRTVR